MKIAKIKCKKLVAKALEDSIKKAVELVFVSLLLGVGIKYILVAVPAVAFGSVIAKIAKIKFFD
jgi:hypothetical protein